MFWQSCMKTAEFMWLGLEQLEPSRLLPAHHCFCQRLATCSTLPEESKLRFLAMTSQSGLLLGKFPGLHHAQSLAERQSLSKVAARFRRRPVAACWHFPLTGWLRMGLSQTLRWLRPCHKTD